MTGDSSGKQRNLGVVLVQRVTLVIAINTQIWNEQYVEAARDFFLRSSLEWNCRTLKSDERLQVRRRLLNLFVR